MYTVRTTHRLFALFLVFTVLLPSVTPYSQVWANNNGPDAPEAASFEPVDATDMVNLLTGDFSYVLPIMNVPSPEGGYPIALSYHGGIAMDLQSSWVGLGWNLNPGAINRSVNGYPDDYGNTLLTEYFYDKGDTKVSRNISVGYSNGAVSLGVGYNWGSHQSSGGYVSIGVGLSDTIGASVSVGFNQPSSVSVGIQTGSGLSFGISSSSESGVSGNIGYNFNNNGTGYSIGASTNGTYSAGISRSNSQTGRGYSVGTTFSSEGVGLTVGVSQKYGKNNEHTGSQSIGISAQTAFSSTINQGDYTVRQSGYNYGIIIPTKIGVFSFSFGKQKVIYSAQKQTNTLVTGPLNFNQAINSNNYYYLDCGRPGYSFTNRYRYLDQAERKKKEINLICGNCCGKITARAIDEAFMDIYEIPLNESENRYAENFNITENNPVFPAYDKYNVQAQGLSGSIHATLVDNGRLFGLSKQTEENGTLNYEFDGTDLVNGKLPQKFDFRSRPEFYFDNEISTYLVAPKATFHSMNKVISERSIKKAFSSLNGKELTTNRFKKSNHIEYATNEELLSNTPQDRGFLKPETPLNRSNLPQNGIGAYKITAADGKTYHYALPVYNHEIVTRTYGIVKERPNEKDSYLEKRQLEPYATHWLLTAVTGADYVDNGDGIAGKGDLGYWVNFDYGLWSDAYVWSPHPDKPYIEDEESNSIKTWIKGRKQVYYLDKINTRTHTAVFIKSTNKEDKSLNWRYSSVAHNGTKQENRDFKERFNLLPHNGAKLDRILLLKNEDFSLRKDGGVDTSLSVNVNFNDSNKPSQKARYKLKHNIYNEPDDNWKSLRTKALKEIVFNQDYTLSNKQLSLQSVDFKGKKGASVLPPYHFSYVENKKYNYNKEDANDWGYYKDNPSLWSLNKITTPQGGKIEVDYDSHNFKVVHPHSRDFVLDTKEFKRSRTNTYTYEIDSQFNFKSGAKVDVIMYFFDNIVQNKNAARNQIYSYTYDEVRYNGQGVVNKIVPAGPSKNKVSVKLSGRPSITQIPSESTSIITELNGPNSYNAITFDTTNKDLSIRNTGARVRKITTTDGIQKYTSSYTYGEKEDGLGWITYLPYAPNAQADVPYSSELPPSRPMYEYVTHKTIDNHGKSTGKVVYQFNVLKHRDKNKIKYGDFYELSTPRKESKTSGNKKVSINEYVIHDKLSNIGQLLSVSTYNKKEQLLSKLSNTYCSPKDLPNKMGVVQESYQSYKIHLKGNTNWLINGSTRIKYPSLLKSSTELRNGVNYTTTFSDFDLTSGQAKRTHSVSSLGLEMKTESKPAFYYYPKMGSKAVDINNKNMLSQGAQSLSYFRKKSTDPWKLYNAEVETWKEWDKDIWRKYQMYSWRGDLNSDGSYSGFKPFNYNKAAQATGWQKTSEITKYSNYSKVLETMDINGNKVSQKLGDNQSKVMAVCNAAHDEMFYENFEYPNRLITSFDHTSTNTSTENNLGLFSSSTIDATRAHTGKYSLKAPSGSGFSSFIESPGKYKSSIWLHTGNYKNTVLFVNNKEVKHNPDQVIEAGDWVQLNFNFEISHSGTIRIVTKSIQAYYDDFRVHPVNASMTSYVYNEWDELTHVLGPNNMATKYEYDAAGKLYKTYTEVAKNGSTIGGFKLISKNNYNYKNQ